MVHLRDPLNARQIEVLNWIAAGCPDGVMDGYAFKTTAVALHNRHLVTISRKQGIWRAKLTDSGAHYVKNGDFPAPAATALPKSLRAGRATDNNSKMNRVVPEVPGVSSSPVVKEVSPGPRAKPLSKTEQLIADLIANDGELKIDTIEDKIDYDARVAAAIRFGKVPAGKQLVIDGWRSSWHRTVRLQDAPAWVDAPLEPIAIPATLRNPHPVVAALRDRDSRFSISGPGRQRALRLVQALTTEADARGYKAKATEIRQDRYGYSQRDTKDDFAVTVKGHSVGIAIQQQVDRTPHEATVAELDRARRDSRYRIPKNDSELSDRLIFALSGPYEHRQSRWADTKRESLDTRLPQILQEIELRGMAAENARLAAEEAACQRMRLWEVAMERAKSDFDEAYRSQVLERQLDDWLKAGRMRLYLAAMEEKIGVTIDAVEVTRAQRWLDWARERTVAMDPLSGILALPEPPEPTADQLRPFLGGLSPHGPTP